MKESVFLRMLDRYIGALLCFLLSLLRRRNPAPPSQLKRILFIELFEMGAALMSYSALQEFQKSYPDAELHVITTKGNKEAWELLGLIHPNDIHTINGSSLITFIKSFFGIRKVLSAQKFDVAIDLQKFSRISAIIGAWSGAQKLVGFYHYEMEGLYRGSLIDIRCNYNQNMHIAKNILALVRTLIINSKEYPNYKGPILSSDISVRSFQSNSILAEKTKKKLQAHYTAPLPKQIFSVFPDVGGNLRVRNYPVTSYAEVIKKILATNTEAICLILGVPSDASTCAELQRLVNHPRCVNFCGKTESIAELMEVLSLSELLISNDNGPIHFASLCKTKVVGLFSTDSPYIYGPVGDALVLYAYYHCSPCISAFNHGNSRCTNNRCLQVLTPQYVAAMALRHLKGEFPARTINGQTSYL